MVKKSLVTDEMLSIAIASSTSMMEVLRKLGVREAGGSHSHYSRKAKKLGLDISHFIGKAWNKGLPSKKKRSAVEILILRSSGRRENSKRLTRALIEIGRPHICDKCKTPPFWNGHQLTLDVDHINEDWLDDRAENLRFLCPNCHSQFSRGLLTKPIIKERKERKKETIPRKTKIDWTVVDLIKLIEVDKMPMTRIGSMLGVSDNAVRKRYNKILEDCALGANRS